MTAHGRRIVVITGLSGAGRSTVMHAMEDLGYFCVDNLPAALLPAFAELCAANAETLGRVALVIDIRERGFFEAVVAHLGALTEAGLTYEVLFLEANTETLLARYRESRRRHPMAGAANDLRAAIEAERAKLSIMPRQADAVIDTTRLNVHQLREIVRERYGTGQAPPAMQVLFLSFGYRYGVPPEVDLVFDARCLPNPHYDPTLRPMTGVDPAVREFVLDAPATTEFLARVLALLEFLVPAYAGEGRSYLTIGIGCTGGRHRSVAVAAALAERLPAAGVQHVEVQHRDLYRAN